MLASKFPDSGDPATPQPQTSALTHLFAPPADPRAGKGLVQQVTQAFRRCMCAPKGSSSGSFYCPCALLSSLPNFFLEPLLGSRLATCTQAL